MENELIKQSFEPKSTLIKKVEYSYFETNEKRMNERMLIEFTTGQIHEYQCTEKDYLGIAMSESAGKHWHKNIKGILTCKIIKR